MTRVEAEGIARAMDCCLGRGCENCPSRKTGKMTNTGCAAQTAGMVEIPYALAEATLIALRERLA